MQNLEPTALISPTNQNFSDFEKEALGEMVLNMVKSDLQQYLAKFHLQQMKDLEVKMVGFEQTCARQIQASLERHVRLQLEAHFQKVVETCQKNISQVTSPLFNRAEKDVQSLSHTINKANDFCTNIQNQYALRWSQPFFVLIASAALAGALMGIILLFLQVPLLSVFCMNAQTREAYETGLRIIEMRKELEARAAQMSISTPQKQEIQKTPETPKQKKKKTSK